MNTVYRVYIREFERGWGNKICDNHDFNSLENAKEFQKDFNSLNNLSCAPDYYEIAEDPLLIDLDAKLK